MAIAPQSICYLCTVPWDSSYTNFRLYANKTTQADEIIKLSKNDFARDNYVFIRPYGNHIRVPFRSDYLQINGINYLMFRNGDSDKWWYCFVNQIVYINDDVSDLVFTVDVLQSWWFDVSPRPCFVEREHTQDDTLGNNLLDEPLSTGDYIVNGTKTTDDLKEYVAVVVSAMYAQSGDIVGHNAQGGWIDTAYSGAGVFIFDLSNETPENDKSLRNWLRDLSTVGAGNAVSSIYLYPKDFLASNTPFGENIFGSAGNYQSQYMPSTSEFYSYFDANLDGYKPRNMKLYTYPFNFMRVSNNNGSYKDYPFEYFEHSQAGLLDFNFQLRGAMSPSGDILCIPKNYNGQEYNMQEYLNMGGYAQVPWTYDGYANWLAQNAGSMLATLGAAAISAYVPAMTASMWVPYRAQKTGVSGTLGAFTGNLARNGSTAATNDMYTYWARREYDMPAHLNMNNKDLQKAESKTVGDFINATHQPSTVKGQSSNSALQGIGYGIFTIMHMCVRKDIAERIDTFFDVYGYNTQKTKYPNFSGRKSWNYVKTRNASFQGTCPPDVLASINDIFNNGCTLWHTNDIGNYSLDNSIEV